MLYRIVDKIYIQQSLGFNFADYSDIKDGYIERVISASHDWVEGRINQEVSTEAEFHELSINQQDYLRKAVGHLALENIRRTVPDGGSMSSSAGGLSYSETTTKPIGFVPEIVLRYLEMTGLYNRTSVISGEKADENQIFWINGVDEAGFIRLMMGQVRVVGYDNLETVIRGILAEGAHSGDSGESGDKGDKGDTGDTGAQGIQGISGEKGDQGEVGATGHQGTRGTQGETGARGPAGSTGAQGIQGIKGDVGGGGLTLRPQDDLTTLDDYYEEQEHDGHTDKYYFFFAPEEGQDSPFETVEQEFGTAGKKKYWVRFTKIGTYTITGHIVASFKNQASAYYYYVHAHEHVRNQGTEGMGEPSHKQEARLDIPYRNENGECLINFIVDITEDDLNKEFTWSLSGEYKATRGINNPDTQIIKIKFGDVGLNTYLLLAPTFSGLSGSKGDMGETGVQGERGINGFTGPSGQRGLQGEQGAKGDTGDAGVDGADGIDGADGTDGENGADGVKGDTGDTGEAGTDGVGLTNAERTKINTNTTKITTLQSTVGSNAGAGIHPTLVNKTNSLVAKTVNLDANGRVVSAPTEDKDLATKKYVDDNSGGGGGESTIAVATAVNTPNSEKASVFYTSGEYPATHFYAKEGNDLNLYNGTSNIPLFEGRTSTYLQINDTSKTNVIRMSHSVLGLHHRLSNPTGTNDFDCESSIEFRTYSIALKVNNNTCLSAYTRLSGELGDENRVWEYRVRRYSVDQKLVDDGEFVWKKAMEKFVNRALFLLYGTGTLDPEGAWKKPANYLQSGRYFLFSPVDGTENTCEGLTISYQNVRNGVPPRAWVKFTTAGYYSIKIRLTVKFTLALASGTTTIVRLVQHEKSGASTAGTGTATTKASKVVNRFASRWSTHSEIEALVHISDATITSGNKYFIWSLAFAKSNLSTGQEVLNQTITTVNDRETPFMTIKKIA